MIGFDTNVLVRYILDDDPVLSASAQRFIDVGCTMDRPGYVNLIVLVELVWVLKQTQGWGRKEICTVISEILLADNLVVENPVLISSALDAYKHGKADFSDFVIAAVNQAAGTPTTVTIDKVAAKEPGFVKLAK